MHGILRLRAEVLRRFANAVAKEFFPGAIDPHASGERIRRIDEPLREAEAVRGCAFRHRRQGGRRVHGDFVAGFVVFAALEHEGVTHGTFLHDHDIGQRAVEVIESTLRLRESHIGLFERIGDVGAEEGLDVFFLLRRAFRCGGLDGEFQRGCERFTAELHGIWRQTGGRKTEATDVVPAERLHAHAEQQQCPFFGRDGLLQHKHGAAVFFAIRAIDGPGAAFALALAVVDHVGDLVAFLREVGLGLLELQKLLLAVGVPHIDVEAAEGEIAVAVATRTAAGQRGIGEAFEQEGGRALLRQRDVKNIHILLRIRAGGEVAAIGLLHERRADFGLDFCRRERCPDGLHLA